MIQESACKGPAIFTPERKARKIKAKEIQEGLGFHGFSFLFSPSRQAKRTKQKYRVSENNRRER